MSKLKEFNKQQATNIKRIGNVRRNSKKPEPALANIRVLTKKFKITMPEIKSLLKGRENFFSTCLIYFAD